MELSWGNAPSNADMNGICSSLPHTKQPQTKPWFFLGLYTKKLEILGPSKNGVFFYGKPRLPEDGLQEFQDNPGDMAMARRPGWKFVQRRGLSNRNSLARILDQSHRKMGKSMLNQCKSSINGA